MSALALLYERGGSAPDIGRLTSMLDAMSHRGVDGRASVVAGAVAVGHLHFWTTPEEVGERQPVRDGSSGLVAVFCGRIDNRDELGGALGLDRGELATLSDAVLFLRGFERWEEGVLARVYGPFAVAVVDPRRSRVVFARDPLGDRALFYHVGADVFAAASEEVALLSPSTRLDEDTVARFFVPEEPSPSRTFFSDVRSLPPGQALEVTAHSMRQWRWSSVVTGSRTRYRCDDDYVDHFRELLDRAVAARLRAVGPPAVMMSGGLDSTAVAAIGAPMVSERGQRLRAVSYVFDELQSCDERRFIQTVVERSQLAATAVVGDEQWPLRDPATWPRNPNTPLEGPYRRLREQVYSAAAQDGTRVLFTGEFGDELYAGGEYWLADFLRQGRLAHALGGVLADRYWRRNGRRPRIYSLRGAIGRALGRATHGFSSAPRPWLTTRGAACPPEIEAAPNHGTRPSQWWTLLHPSAALGNGIEPYHATRAGLEIRRPFRDRRLIEFALSIPAHLLYRPGESKWILRQAMRGVLPEEVRTRRHPTSLQPLFARGLGERARNEAEDLLFDRDALWRPYIREAWLRAAFPRCLRGPDGEGLVAVWRCICAEQWRRGLASRGLGEVGVLSS